MGGEFDGEEEREAVLLPNFDARTEIDEDWDSICSLSRLRVLSPETEFTKPILS